METQYDHGLYHNLVEYGYRNLDAFQVSTEYVYEVLKTLDPKTRTDVTREICKITSRDAHPTN
jgi:hypothetical protein